MTRAMFIKKCKECPHRYLGDLYSLDGFDRGCDWFCKHPNELKKNVNGRKIATFIEWPTEEERILPDEECKLEEYCYEG